MKRVIPDPVIQSLLPELLDEAPLAIAIKKPAHKDTDSVIVYGNKAYWALPIEGEKAKRPGASTRKVFGLSKDHALLANEATVAIERRALMSKESLPGREARWSLRFPIFDIDGKVPFVGVVSPDYRQEVTTSGG